MALLCETLCSIDLYSGELFLGEALYRSIGVAGQTLPKSIQGLFVAA
jgi:hypothetical protein